MAQRKKKKRGNPLFDTEEGYQQWQEMMEDGYRRVTEDADSGGEPEGPALEDFVVLAKVEAFCGAFEPCGEDEAEETFNDARLREFFKAYVCSAGDPLAIYLNRLASEGGFYMQIDSITCEPVIFARKKTL